MSIPALIGPCVDYIHYTLKEKEFRLPAIKHRLAEKKWEAFAKILFLAGDHLKAKSAIAEIKLQLLA